MKKNIWKKFMIFWSEGIIAILSLTGNALAIIICALVLQTNYFDRTAIITLLIVSTLGLLLFFTLFIYIIIDILIHIIKKRNKTKKMKSN